MGMKHIAVYLHLVWGTWDRMEWIEPGIERTAYRMIISAIRKLGPTILAINGMPDHVHVLIKYPTTLTIADVVKRAKGTSSRLINQFNLTDDHFKWGIGYGGFSVSRWDTQKIINYVQRQKEHHHRGDLIEDLESIPYDGI